MAILYIELWFLLLLFFFFKWEAFGVYLQDESDLLTTECIGNGSQIGMDVSIFITNLRNFFHLIFFALNKTW